MSATNETTININVHNTSTEVLIVISQTVFFVLLFLLLKNWLVDKRGMLGSKERINEELLQIIAIFFAIFVMVGLFMIPIESYEYAHYVVPITYCIMVLIIGWEIYVVVYMNTENVSRVTLYDLENKQTEATTSQQQPSSSKSKSWFSGNSGSTSSKRPVNF